MGGDKFIERIQGMIEEKKESREVVRKERLVGRPELREFFQERRENKDTAQRNRLMHEAYIRDGYTLSETGKHLNLHYSTVSKAVKAFETRKARVGNSTIKTCPLSLWEKAREQLRKTLREATFAKLLEGEVCISPSIESGLS